MIPDALHSPETPWWPIVSLRNHYRIMDDFVETGTGVGATSAIAAGLFRRVFTIEINPEMFKRADTALNPHKNVRRYLGDSGEMLPKILAELGPKAIFYLDGHWSGGPRIGKVECPLLAELRLINARGAAEDCIFIDNVGMMTRTPYPPHRPEEWPRITEVVSILKENHKWSVTRVCDTLIATPDPITEVYT